MKRILITVLLTIFCFGIGLTSLIVNDLSNLNKWYQTEVRPTMHKEDHRDIHKMNDRKNENKKEQSKKWQTTAPKGETNSAAPLASPAAPAAPPAHTPSEPAVPTINAPGN